MPQHDQHFKNLILDYPRDALAFFAAAEAALIDDTARITPIRQEQLQERLGERFRELDVPLLVEWPDGRRAAILFLIEQETEPRRFSIHRLGHYCLDLAELFETERVVPVVVFLHPGRVRRELRLGGERKFGAEALAPYRMRVERADPDTLLVWSERILTASSIEEVLGE